MKEVHPFVAEKQLKKIFILPITFNDSLPTKKAKKKMYL